MSARREPFSPICAPRSSRPCAPPTSKFRSISSMSMCAMPRPCSATCRVWPKRSVPAPTSRSRATARRSATTAIAPPAVAIEVAASPAIANAATPGRAGKKASGECPTPLACFGSVLAKDLLAALVALLRFQRQGGDGPGIEAPQPNGLAGFLAVAVGAFLEARQGGIDLGNQLALAIPRPQLEGPVGFRGGTIGEVGVLRGILVQHLQRLPILPDNLLLPSHQLVAEVGLVPFVHKGFVLGGTVAFRQNNNLRRPRLGALWQNLVGRLLFRGRLSLRRLAAAVERTIDPAVHVSLGMRFGAGRFGRCEAIFFAHPRFPTARFYLWGSGSRPATLRGPYLTCCFFKSSSCRAAQHDCLPGRLRRRFRQQFTPAHRLRPHPWGSYRNLGLYVFRIAPKEVGAGRGRPALAWPSTGIQRQHGRPGAARGRRQPTGQALGAAQHGSSKARRPVPAIPARWLPSGTARRVGHGARARACTRAMSGKGTRARGMS